MSSACRKLQACRSAFEFWNRQGRREEAEAFRTRAEARQALLVRAHTEREEVGAGAQFEAHELSPSAVEELCSQLKNCREVRTAFLVRKRSPAPAGTPAVFALDRAGFHHQDQPSGDPPPHRAANPVPRSNAYYSHRWQRSQAAEDPPNAQKRADLPTLTFGREFRSGRFPAQRRDAGDGQQDHNDDRSKREAVIIAARGGQAGLQGGVVGGNQVAGLVG